MAKLANLIKETVFDAPGTGTINLSGVAVAGFAKFQSSSLLGTGSKVHYTAIDGDNREVGIGTLTTGSPWTLVRTTILATVNAGTFDDTSPAALTLSADTVVEATLPAEAAGIIVGYLNSPIASLVSCTGVLAFDNTTPQSTEATVVQTVAYTPKFDDSLLQIEAGWFGCGTAAMYCSALLLKDAGVNAIRSKVFMPSQTSPYIGEGHIYYEEAAATTTARTYKLAIGVNTGTFHVNGDNTGTALFNSTGATYIKVTEVRKIT